MIYGIIYYRGGGKHAFMMRQYRKFQNPKEEQSLTPYIVTIIEEETGDGWLLAEKIAAYAREHHLKLEFPIDLTGIRRSESLSQDERMKMLEMSVHKLAEKLEKIQKTAWELEYAHWHMMGEQGTSSYLLDEIKAIIGIAQIELKCKHLSTAFEKHEQWKRNHLH